MSPQQFQRVYRTVYTAMMAAGVGGFLAHAAGRTPLAILLWVVAGLCALSTILTAVVKAVRQTSARTTAQAGPVVATQDAPAPLPTVLAALDALNDPDIPYEIVVAPAAGGAEVTVRWRIEELRWRSIFGRGEIVYNWKMVVALDEARHTYGFTEFQAKARNEQSVWPPRAAWQWEGFRGKTAGSTSMSVVMTSTGEVRTSGPEGPRTSWVGAVSIRPADAKVPVLTTLRNHGWRPRHDWFGARLFER